MARSIEQLLRELRADPPSLDLVRSALVVKAAYAGVAVAAAAKVCEDHALRELTPELVAAFTALCAPKRDPGCRGRAAIVHALHALEHWAPEVFVIGLRLVQMEGPPGAQFDEGAQIRGACAQSHVHLMRPDALDVCAEMLADSQSIARLGAARGIADSGRIDATALVRYKLARGPDDGEVLAACFDALFELRREVAIEVARAYLAKPDQRADAAALALGGHRVAEALDDLIKWAKRPHDLERKQIAHLALALLRSDGGNAALIDVIKNGNPANARSAAEALATFKQEPAITELITGAAKAIKDRGLRAEILALI
jgi:hypothetical protein